jgi:class 3 adenylate cyclase
MRKNREVAASAASAGSRSLRVYIVRFLNDDSEKFCGGAGNRWPQPPLPRAAVHLTAELYPKHLAEKILTSKSSLAGERKQVTVLFVDVSGFTSLSERLDPEEVHRLMSRAFDSHACRSSRYEARSTSFSDGIMALFGAPIAHEDHARRAVHAALGSGGPLPSINES